MSDNKLGQWGYVWYESLATHGSQAGAGGMLSYHRLMLGSSSESLRQSIRERGS